MSENVFEVSNLNLFYGQHKALSDINMDIQSHTITALIGPSGCGKSTFLRTLNRMNDLIDGVRITGSVLFDNKDVYTQTDPLDLRRRVGMVFQKPNPFPSSIYDNVAYAPRLHKRISKSELDNIVEDCLKKASLWDEVKDCLKKSAYSLSGGQQQRLCIARTLAASPEVILMDEPTSALDPLSTTRIENLMDDLKKNYTIVTVTHNMQQASRISDKTGFFFTNQEKSGFLVEYGDTEELFFNPRDKRTEDYITGRFG